MKYQFVEYQSHYLKASAAMMMETWNYHHNFHTLKDPNYFYETLFKMSYFESTYTEIVVDENDNPLGYLIAKTKKRNLLQNLKLLRFYCQITLAVLLKKYGNPLDGLKELQQYEDLKKQLLTSKIKFDSEILLFFISSRARGLGLGKQLMNRFIKYCHANNIKNVILITDISCNYGFYDYYGFSIHKKIKSAFLETTKEPYNGFSYVLQLNNRQEVI